MKSYSRLVFKFGMLERQKMRPTQIITGNHNLKNFIKLLIYFITEGYVLVRSFASLRIKIKKPID